MTSYFRNYDHEKFQNIQYQDEENRLILTLASLCKVKAAEQTSKPSTFSKQRNDLQYGIKGCGEFSKGVQN